MVYLRTQTLTFFSVYTLAWWFIYCHDFRYHLCELMTPIYILSIQTSPTNSWHRYSITYWTSPLRGEIVYLKLKNSKINFSSSLKNFLLSRSSAFQNSNSRLSVAQANIRAILDSSFTLSAYRRIWQILSTMPSDCIQNLTTSHCLHSTPGAEPGLIWIISSAS